MKGKRQKKGKKAPARREQMPPCTVCKSLSSWARGKSASQAQAAPMLACRLSGGWAGTMHGTYRQHVLL